MKTKAKTIILYVIRIFLMLFWLYVALEKLWGLQAFHVALLRQPFPNWGADILYWLLPGIELITALLFVIAGTCIAKSAVHSQYPKVPTVQSQQPICSRHSLTASTLPFVLSTVLLTIFSLYIALGVAGLYSKLPCGCASVFRNLSWEWHLVANVVLLGLSALGWYLNIPSSPSDTDVRYKKSINLFCAFLSLTTVALYHIVLVVFKEFPKKFALFPGRPVAN